MIKIGKKEECSGCYACLNVCPVKCIVMEKDFEGFEYPKVVKAECINCKKCIEVCPLIKKRKVETKKLNAFACFNKNEKIRMESSSGGIFTLLAEKIIVDGGIVFGATWNKEMSLEHTFVEKLEELNKLRGSKYLQSKIGESFIQVSNFLNNGKKVLFSGTPCQIEGLNSFLEKKISKEKRSNLLMVDFICHGVPSPKVWEKYKKESEKKYNSILRDAKFRNKDNGWKLFNIQLKFSNGKEQIKSLREDKYMKSFLNDICLRPSCHECGFKSKNRISDITLADFWGIQNIKPKMDDDKGISLILLHSKEGKKCYLSILEKMISEKVDVDEALIYNSAALKSPKPHLKRDMFFKELDSLEFNILCDKFLRRTLKSRLKNLIKKIKKRVHKDEKDL